MSPTWGGRLHCFATNLRQFTTTVLADDGEIIVIGGLIERSNSVVNSKVPVAGDIPVVGNLFKSEAVNNGRTNLMVFIRPTIVRNADEARGVTSRNYRYIRAEELLREGDAEAVSELDAFISSVLDVEIEDSPMLRGRVE